MNAPTALIAEDEPVLRAELKAALASLWPELVICAEAGDGTTALDALQIRRPDLLFLDIQMPGLNGLEVVSHTKGNCHVVFVTAFDQYAVAAFEQGAVDYIVKPLSMNRLATAVARLKQRLQGAPANLDGVLKYLAGCTRNDKEYLRWITALQGGRLRFITVDEVLYFQADNKYTRVIVREAESLIRRPIRELATEVDPSVFWQIHRSTLVNVNSIAGIARDFRGHLQLQLKHRNEMLQVSESFAHLFKQM